MHTHFMPLLNTNSILGAAADLLHKPLQNSIDRRLDATLHMLTTARRLNVHVSNEIVDSFTFVEIEQAYLDIANRNITSDRVAIRAIYRDLNALDRQYRTEIEEIEYTTRWWKMFDSALGTNLIKG